MQSMNVVFMQTLTGGTIILIQALAVIIHGEHGLHSTIIMAVITRATTVCGRAHLQLR